MTTISNPEPFDHEHGGQLYSKFGYLRVTCAECNCDLACYTHNPYTCIFCRQCEEKYESS